MKNFALFLIIFILLLNMQFTCAKTNKIPVNLVRVVDGDTVILQIDDNKFPVRLQGIDCFETSKIPRAYMQAYKNNLSIDDVIKKGNESLKFLQDLFSSDKDFYLDFKGLDKYNRVLGILYLNNQNINQELIKHGGCMVYTFKNSN